MTSNLVRAAIFSLASLSILSLLLYFLGVAQFRSLAIALLVVEVMGLVWLCRKKETGGLILCGLMAGALATLAYDVVRVPIVRAGVPVFKAISYFGTVFVGVDRPTPASEVAGWLYHVSNGVSFGLMYAALVHKPAPLTAVLWGLALEAAMLLTPYAEVFGYRRDARFLTITIGSHAVYGLTLWWGLRTFSIRKLNLWSYAALTSVIAVALVLIANDFSQLHARNLPVSPPPYIGRHLYTAWNVPEPDRIAVLWVMKRFVDPDAEFHFVEPFDKVRFGTPFDIPEAEIRRRGTQSATAVLVEKAKITGSPRLMSLVRMTDLAEVSPWMLSTDAEASDLADLLRTTADRACGSSLSPACLPKVFGELDRWYSVER